MPSLESIRPFSTYNNVWIEVTRTEHGHGGAGWEYGQWLWSPSTNKSGGDLYKGMREVRSGDLVFHFLRDRWHDGGSDSRIHGVSLAAGKYREVTKEPPSPGDWAGMASYYKVQLKDFTAFPKATPLRQFLTDFEGEIRGDILGVRPKHYPFVAYGDKQELRLGQGMYLARCTPDLFAAIIRATSLAVVASADASDMANQEAAEYAETRRLARERYYFARNPSLKADAIAARGTRCEVCKIDFGEKYGSLGAGYIECHHVDPLSERLEENPLAVITTTVDDVALLCANCHRMIHRRRPALQLDELASYLTP